MEECLKNDVKITCGLIELNRFFINYVFNYAK